MALHLRMMAALRLVGLAVVLGALAYFAPGCAHPCECYESVAIVPTLRTAIIFDKCRGEVIYQNVPPLPSERAVPEA